MTLAELRENMEFLQNQISTADGETKTQLEESLASTIAAITRMTGKMGTSDPAASHSKTAKLKVMENAISDVPLFGGTVSTEAESFCGRLDQIFHLLITNGDTSLEADFVKFATMRLSQPVFKHLLASKADTSTFEKFKDTITTTYGPKLNACQLMNRLYDIEFDDKAKLSIFAQQCNETVRVGYAALNAQWKKAKNTNDDISAEQSCHFFAMGFMLQNIKNSNFQLYRDLIRDLDEIFDPNQLAARAEYFIDRTGTANVSNTLFNNRHNRNNRRYVPNPGQAGKSNRHDKSKSDVCREDEDEKTHDKHSKSTENGEKKQRQRRRKFRRGPPAHVSDDAKTDHNPSDKHNASVYQAADAGNDESFFTSPSFQ